MNKRVLFLAVATLALSACGSEPVTPAMIKRAQEACSHFGGLDSFMRSDTNSAYRVKASCADGTYLDAIVGTKQAEVFEPQRREAEKIAEAEKAINAHLDEQRALINEKQLENDVAAAKAAASALQSTK